MTDKETELKIKNALVHATPEVFHEILGKILKKGNDIKQSS